MLETTDLCSPWIPCLPCWPYHRPVIVYTRTCSPSRAALDVLRAGGVMKLFAYLLRAGGAGVCRRQDAAGRFFLQIPTLFPLLVIVGLLAAAVARRCCGPKPVQFVGPTGLEALRNGQPANDRPTERNAIIHDRAAVEIVLFLLLLVANGVSHDRDGVVSASQPGGARRELIRKYGASSLALPAPRDER